MTDPAKPSNPQIDIASRTRWGILRDCSPFSFARYLRYAFTVRSSSAGADSPSQPRCRLWRTGSARISTPSKVAVPDEGIHIPAKIFKSVVLPAPFAPVIATTSPDATENVTSERMLLPPLEKLIFLTSNMVRYFIKKNACTPYRDMIYYAPFFPHCSGGEIGRHACLRCMWRDPCGFESRPEHH